MEKGQNKKEKIDYHNGFFAAFCYVYYPYMKDWASREREENLTTMPLRIDQVLIKKDASMVYDTDLARHFKRVNILEYKSYRDELNIFTICKMIAYAGLYCYLHRNTHKGEREQVDPDEVAITIYRHVYPKALFDYVKGHLPRCKCKKISDGVYE